MPIIGVMKISRAGRIEMKVVVPPNASASVVPPEGGEAIEIGSGTHAFSFEAGVIAAGSAS